MSRLQARARREADPLCPLCRDALADAAARRCTACHTAYHADCLVELGGCATLGCRLQGTLPAAEAAWRCRTCHDPIDDAETPTPCPCGARLHPGCVGEHATDCRRARPLLGPPTPARLLRALAPGLVFGGVFLGVVQALPTVRTLSPLHGLLALALALLPLGLHLLDARREANANRLAALQLAEPLLLGLGTGTAVAIQFSRLLQSQPPVMQLGAVFMGVWWGFFGALFGVPLVGATDCLVVAPRRFVRVARGLLARFVIWGVALTALASPLYLRGVFPLSVCMAGVAFLALLAAAGTLGRRGGRGLLFC